MKLLSVVLVLLLAACATSLPKIEPEKLPQPPAAFKEGDGRWTQAAPAEAQPRGEWWKAFADPVLDELVERANRSNTSIQVAAARLAQARAFVRATDANRSPQIGVGASATRAQGIVGGVAVGPARNIFATGVDFSYEADLFGRLSHATDAATLDAQAQEGLLQSARLLVQAQVAQTYLALRAIDAERSLVRSTVGAYRETLTLTERRWRAGDVAELDVARATAEADLSHLAGSCTETLQATLDEVAAEVEQLERDGVLASPRPVDDAPEASELEGEGEAPAAGIEAGDAVKPEQGRTMTADEMVLDLRAKIDRMTFSLSSLKIALASLRRSTSASGMLATRSASTWSTVP